MKLKLAFAFSFVVVFCFGQSKKSTTMGKTTIEELKMQVYQKDTTARAVVLYEHGNYYINTKDKFKYKFTTDFYFRIKILKTTGFDKATIKIPFYDEEEVYDIQAVTNNLTENNVMHTTSLEKDKIYTKDLSGKWKETYFTLPNIKVGSVIEFRYSLISSYLEIDDWKYQSDIPKLKSDFTAAIIGNFKYNIRLVGNLKLHRENFRVKNGCFYLPGIGTGPCGVLEYGMDAVPAFKKEDHMLSQDNYVSRLSFELISKTDVGGQVTNYTKTWKAVDKKLETYFLSGQYLKKRYFKENLSSEASLNSENSLERAKQIYKRVQNHYTWNEKYWLYRKVEVKKAFKNTLGSVFEINLSLYFALQAANIESKLVLLSTRDREIPTKLHPVISDFNYMVVRAVIDNQVYFLDAVNKYLGFGLIQSESLNGEGRVMDFKNGSFWEQINLRQKTSETIRLSLLLKDDSFVGDLSIKRTGYFAVHKRVEFDGLSEDDILEDFENNYPNIEVEDVALENLGDNDKALNESYKITIETDVMGSRKIRLNPFVIDKIGVNPFKLNKRDYPVDFGYERSKTYLMELIIPETYKIAKLPKNTGVALPNKGGKIIFNTSQIGNTINIYLKFSLNKKSYSADEYFYLKQFYKKLINVQDSFIEIEKI